MIPWVCLLISVCLIKCSCFNAHYGCWGGGEGKASLFEKLVLEIVSYSTETELQVKLSLSWICCCMCLVYESVWLYHVF